jgi:hypothetical protein
MIEEGAEHRVAKGATTTFADHEPHALLFRAGRVRRSGGDRHRQFGHEEPWPKESCPE